MSSSDEYEHLTVEIDNETKSRAREGRQPRRQREGELRTSKRGGESPKETFKGFWDEVVSGSFGLKKLPVKSPQDVMRNRTQASLIEGQIVSIPEATLVKLD